MFDLSENNSQVPRFLRLVLGIECSVVFVAGVLLFFLPGLASDLWAWTIPPFNSRFVGAVYLAAYLPLILFWFVPRWKPGWLTLWMILTFTMLVMITMFIHWNFFEWGRPATFIFWLLYVFLPINSTIFLVRSQGTNAASEYDGPAGFRMVLRGFALLGAVYGLGLMIAPEALTSFWPWKVDAFHGRMYAAAFVTPAVGAWLLSLRRQFAVEYLSMGLNLAVGGFLPIIGILWTNMFTLAERQINFGSAGTWMFFLFFFLTGILGIVLIRSAVQLSNNLPAAQPA